MKDTVGKLNPYRFRGYRYDSETGLYYLQSRYYNPEICRMLNADSLCGQVGELLSHNMFAYCGNNAVNNYDPSGYYMVDIVEEDIINNTAHNSGLLDNVNTNIVYSKTRHSQRDSGMRGLSNDEIQKGARDKSLPGAIRKKYQAEEKYRGLRNQNKRKEKNKCKIELFPTMSSFTEDIGKATGLTGATLIIYIIISEGSRLFPARNLIPIP